MTYFSAARGYKAGGFNLDRTQVGVTPTTSDTSFPGEFVDSYELSAKTTWAGGNLLLNGALFHQTYSDFQLNSFLGTSFVVRSIPKVTSQGLDAELLWQPTPGLMLQAGLGPVMLPNHDVLGGAFQVYVVEEIQNGQLAFAWRTKDPSVDAMTFLRNRLETYMTGDRRLSFDEAVERLSDEISDNGMIEERESLLSSLDTIRQVRDELDSDDLRYVEARLSDG